MKGEHAKKNIKMVALVALLVVFFFGRGVEGIERRVGVKEKKLSIASQFFGDVETETLFAQMDLEDDLEVSYDLFCSSQNYKKLNTYKSNPGCVPCNYTGEQSSDGTCADENLNPSLPYFEGLNLPNCPCNPTYCEGTIIRAGEDPQYHIFRESDLRLVFRYKHTDFESGFAVKVTPVDEGPVNFLVANALSVDAQHTLAYSYSTSPYEYLKICPSFNRFGAGSESITYFIIVLPGDLAGNGMASFNISVEQVPTLTEDEEGDYQLLEFFNGTGTSLDNTLGNDPFYIEGTYLSNYYNGTTPDYYPILLNVPLTQCTSYSVSFEYTHLNTSQFDYFSLVDVVVWRVSEDDLRVVYQERERPFRVEEVVETSYNESKPVSITSEGRIFFDCPTKSSNEKEYISIRISPGPVFSDWGLLIFLRETTPDSRTRLNRKLSELPPLVHQRLLRPEIGVRCPCQDPCDKCDSRDIAERRFFNRLSGLTPETFPALISQSQQNCDLASEIGVQIRDDFLFHCHSYWRDSSCGVIRVIPIFSSVNPRIYPMPLVIRLLQQFSFSVAPNFLATQDINNIQEIENDSIGVLFTLSANGVNYFDKNRIINQCEMRIAYPTMLHNSKDEPPTDEHFSFSSFENYTPGCTESSFLTINSLLSEAEMQLELLTQSGVLVGSGIVEEGDDETDELTAEELFESSAAAAYASYSLLFSQEWQSCQELADSFLIFEQTNETIEDSPLCGNLYDPDDPCCNTDLQWEDCCVAEGREIVTTQVDITTNEIQLDDVCQDSICMETFAEDYGITYNEVFFGGICENKFILPTGLHRVVSECREHWIGSDEFGKLCYSDRDCQDIFETGLCDLSLNRCTGVREEMEIGFLTCLMREVDSVTRSAIVNELAKVGLYSERNEGIEVTIENLKTYLYNEGECVSDYGPMSHLRARFVARSLEKPEDQLCPVCYDLYCLSPYGCEWPLQCLDKRQLCGATIVPYTSPFCVNNTDDNLQCDYNASLTEEECDLDTPLCLFCHNSSNCIPLPATNKGECENTPLCLMPGGEVLWDVSEDECERKKYCTEKCLGETCPDQESCEQIGGFCEDSDAILESVISAAEVEPRLRDASNGVCITPIMPFNTPACPYVTENIIMEPGAFDFRTGNSWDFTTHRGCVVFSDCLPLSIQFADGTGGARLPEICDWKPKNITECEEDYMGTWLELPIQTQQSCENPLNTNEEDFPGFCLEDSTGASPYLSRKTRRECQECGGIPRTPAKWRKGRWEGGLARRGEWRAPKMVSTYHYVNDSISFHALNNLLALSSADVKAFLNDISISCGVSPFVDYLSLFSCNCDEENNSCQDPLLNQEQNIIGGVWLCPNVNSKVGLPVGSIQVNGSEVNGTLCKFSQVALAPAEIFVGNHKRVPLTVLGDPNPIDAEPVRNSKGGSVGGVVGDGVQLLYEDTGFVDFGREVKEVKITLFIDTKVLIEFPFDYVFDFGIEILDDDDVRFSGEIELRPMSAKITPNPQGEIEQETTIGELLQKIGDQEVVGLTGYWEKPFGNDSPRLFPIVREQDYEAEPKNDVLSEGEKIMVAVFSGLYGVATIFSLIMLILLFFVAPSITNLVFSFFIFLAFLFRCVYLALYASGELREESISSFILVEPPSFFILSVASVLAMSFGFCLHCIKKNVPQEKAFARFWGYWIIFNIFLYLVLVVVLLLETLLDIDDKVTISCYGRRVEVEESFTIQAIRIGYHSFLLIIAIITAFALFFLGHSLKNNLQYDDSLSSLSVVSGVSVIFSNVLWVVYSGLSGASPYFVIALFCVEVPPLVVIMVLVLPRRE